jgi:hypothetical protein
MQVSAAHEYTEAVTDPIIAENYRGWENEGGGGEIADICNTGTPSEQAEAAPGIWVAKVVDDYLWAASGNRCVAQDAGPVRFDVSTGGPSLSAPHSANLVGGVNPAGWGANYNFAFTGPSGTTYLPGSRNQNPDLWLGFSAVPNSFASQVVTVQVSGLKGNTTYQVRLDANGPLVRGVSGEDAGHISNMSGQTLAWTTPDWRPSISY